VKLGGERERGRVLGREGSGVSDRGGKGCKGGKGGETRAGKEVGR
jgi:hypothetical protein